MDIKQSAAECIRKCGERVEVMVNGTAVETFASIQPIKYKNRSYFSEKYLKLGNTDETNYVYMGEPIVRLDLLPFDTIVRSSGESYVVKRAQKVCVGRQIIYIWGILQRYIEEE